MDNKNEAIEMLEAIENAKAVAALNGFDGIYFALDNLADGLINYYDLKP
ncbi:MAG: hypothetical protein HDR49_00205 [Bacteroides sp.]|nr:hypothetical protein [Bacteroides sp.]